MEAKQITQMIADFEMTKKPRLRRLHDYYMGRHDILLCEKDPGKPHHRVINNFCRNITDSTAGYFMGKPVMYDSKDSHLLNLVQSINTYNDEQFCNSSLARDLSVYGCGCEILYVDSDHALRFCPVDPKSVIPVFDSSVEKKLTMAIRYYTGRNPEMLTAEVYTEDMIYVYQSRDGAPLALVSETGHGFGQVPVNVYFNNSDAGGDFEPVLSLVDAYNLLQSESINDFELFADSYLVISGMSGTQPEDIERLRHDRVLLLEESGDAKWLTKNVNDVHVENLKSRIAKDIYRFSSTVDMTDDSWSSYNASGTAAKFRMLNFENRVAGTERFFKKGLQRRYEMICAFANLLGGSPVGGNFDWRDLEIRFVRNLPMDVLN